MYKTNEYSLSFWEKLGNRLETSKAQLSAEIQTILTPRQVSVESFVFEVNHLQAEREKFFKFMTEFETIHFLLMGLNAALYREKVEAGVFLREQEVAACKALLAFNEDINNRLISRNEPEARLRHAQERIDQLRLLGQSEVVSAERNVLRAIQLPLTAVGVEDLNDRASNYMRLETYMHEREQELAQIRATTAFPYQVDALGAEILSRMGLALTEIPDEDTGTEPAAAEAPENYTQDAAETTEPSNVADQEVAEASEPAPGPRIDPAAFAPQAL